MLLYGLLGAIAVLFDMYMMFVPHWEHTYAPTRPVTGIAFLSHFCVGRHVG
jgi:hypothetical protein